MSASGPLRWDMKWLVATILGLALLLPCQAMPQAQGALVPDYGITMPYYWSGTNCRAIGNLYVLPPPTGGGAAFFTDAALLIGSQVVRTWSHGDTPYQQVMLAVMFDSTHFLHGTNLAVSILGHDNYGREYFASNTSVVSNSARCWTFPEFMEIAGGAGGDIARDMLEAMNYDASHECGFWDRQTFCDNLSGSVQYVNSHGGWDGGLPNRYHTAGIGGVVLGAAPSIVTIQLCQCPNVCQWEWTSTIQHHFASSNQCDVERVL